MILSRAEDFADRCGGESGVGRKFFGELRRTSAQSVQASNRHFFRQLVVPESLDEVEASRVGPGAVVNAKRFVAERLIFRVSSPITRNYVEPAIPVKVGGGYSVPPTGELLQTTLRFDKLGIDPLENVDRAPIARENQFRES